jgi:hypothetical protein
MSSWPQKEASATPSSSARSPGSGSAASCGQPSASGTAHIAMLLKWNHSATVTACSPRPISRIAETATARGGSSAGRRSALLLGPLQPGCRAQPRPAQPAASPAPSRHDSTSMPTPSARSSPQPWWPPKMKGGCATTATPARHAMQPAPTRQPTASLSNSHATSAVRGGWIRPMVTASASGREKMETCGGGQQGGGQLGSSSLVAHCSGRALT